MLIRINEHYAVEVTSIVSIRFHAAARPSHGVIGDSVVLHVHGEGQVMCDLMRVPGKSAHEACKDLVSAINTARVSRGLEAPSQGLTATPLAAFVTQDEDYGYDGCHHSDFDPGA